MEHSVAPACCSGIREELEGREYCGLLSESVVYFLLKLMSAIQKGRVSGSRLAILMKTAEENLDRRVLIPVDRSCGGL